jgi:hypothetical protein
MIKIAATTLLCAGLCAGFLSAATAADTTAAAAPASHYDEALISAKGSYLGIVSHDDVGNKIVSVVNLNTMQPTKSLKFTVDHSIEDVWWASDDKLVFSKSGDFDNSQSGELYSVDAEGPGTTYLYGRNGDAHTGSHLGGAKQERGLAHMVDPLPLDPDHILAAIARPDENAFYLSEIDLHNATRRTVSTLNYSWYLSKKTRGGLSVIAGHVATDGSGRPRYAIAINFSGKFVEVARSAASDNWQLVDETGTDERTELLGVNSKGDTAYLIRSEDGCLMSRDLSTLKANVVTCEEPLTRSNISFQRVGGEPIVVTYHGNHPPVFIEPDSFEAKAYRSLQKSFGNQYLRVMSSTPDSHKLIVEVSGSGKPGELYFIDLDTKKAQFLVSQQPGNDAQAAPAKPSAVN